jgi:ABC-type lipoprotein release transport system permease subunit
LNLPFKIAKRYFFSRKKQNGFNAISIISYISLLGYAVGAAALLIILSVFNGFEGLFSNMYSNFDADLQILPSTGKGIRIDKFPIQKIIEEKWLAGISAVWEENALLRYNGKQTIATIKAVDDGYLRVNHLDSNLLRGSLLLKNGDTSFAVVGQGIGYQLGIDPDDQFHYLGIYLPKKGKVDMLDPSGAFAHGLVFPVGIIGVQEEVDNKYVLLPLNYVFNQIEDSLHVSLYELRLHNKEDIERASKDLRSLLGTEFIIKNRFEQREAFYKVMQSEKSISYFILVFILLIAAFNTIGSLYMLVIEKRRDLNVFSTLGLNPNQAAFIFLFQSLFIAISGGIFGILIGLSICYGQQEYSWIALQTNGDKMISAYPIILKAKDSVLVFFTLIGIGIFTSLYPAWKAKNIVSQKSN